MVKLKEPLTGLREDGTFKDPTVFTKTLGNVAAGGAFFIPRRLVQTRDTAGEIQEDTEVHVLVESIWSAQTYKNEPDFDPELEFRAQSPRCASFRRRKTEEIRSRKVCFIPPACARAHCVGREGCFGGGGDGRWYVVGVGEAPTLGLLLDRAVQWWPRPEGLWEARRHVCTDVPRPGLVACSWLLNAFAGDLCLLSES